MNDEPLLRFEHATLGYERRPVLTDVDFAVSRGSFVGILGYNGSGKTTILKTILGIIPCIKGRFILQNGEAGLPRFGYVPQKEKLDPIYPLTAHDVVAMGTYRRFELLGRLRQYRVGHVVRHCLSECGASHIAHKSYGDLSGGQKQRVLIARALAAEPDILALDEPLAGIDVATQKSLVHLLNRLKEKEGLTVLMISHRIRAEKGLFTHIAWVDESRVVVGAAEEMLRGTIGEVFRSEL